MEAKEGLQIRDARPDELDRVAELLKRAFQQYQSAIPAEVWQGYAQDLIDVKGRLAESEQIVAELGGRLVGAVTLYVKSAAEMGWPEGWAGVRLLAVDPAYRGRGIGRALMDECVRRCRQEGLNAIGLHTARMMKYAERLYRSMGFRRVPAYDHHPAPGVVVMAYRLKL